MLVKVILNFLYFIFFKNRFFLGKKLKDSLISEIKLIKNQDDEAIITFKIDLQKQREKKCIFNRLSNQQGGIYLTIQPDASDPPERRKQSLDGARKSLLIIK